jgi:hypothetical protein
MNKSDSALHIFSALVLVVMKRRRMNHAASQEFGEVRKKTCSETALGGGVGRKGSGEAE